MQQLENAADSAILCEVIDKCNTPVQDRANNTWHNRLSAASLQRKAGKKHERVRSVALADARFMGQRRNFPASQAFNLQCSEVQCQEAANSHYKENFMRK